MTANERTQLTTALEIQASQEIDNIPLFAPNTQTCTGSVPYRSGSYNICVKYNRIGNGYNYPALVWAEYWSGGVLYDSRNTYRHLEARDSREKEAMKLELQNWLVGQIVADTSGASSHLAQMTARERLFDLLPMGSAHAQTTAERYIIPRRSLAPVKVPYPGGYSQINYYLSGTRSLHTAFTAPSSTIRQMAAGRTLTDVKIKSALIAIGPKLTKIAALQSACTGAGSLLPKTDTLCISYAEERAHQAAAMRQAREEIADIIGGALGFSS